MRSWLNERDIKLPRLPLGYQVYLTVIVLLLVHIVSTIINRAFTQIAPTAPSGISLTVHDSETIIAALTDNSSTELYFEWERKTGAGGTYTKIDIAYANYIRIIDDTLTPSTAYFYRARSCNASGCSSYATEQSATTSSAPTPSASLSVPSTAFAGEVILVDARASTGICRRPQSDGTPSVTLDFGDGFTAELPAVGHVYLAAGSYTVSVTFKNCAGASGTTNTGITVTEIPACTGGNCRTATEQGSASANRTHVQGLIDAAAAANSVEQEVIIPASMVLNGDLIMPTPTGGAKYITIRSDSSSLPARKKRVTPSDTAAMPTIQARTGQSYPNNVALQTPTSAPASPPHHYRWIGLHLKKDSSATAITTLANIGTDSGGGQNAISELPHHFIVERCWFDGDDAVATSQINTGLRIYGNYVSVLDSRLSAFRLIGTGVDTSAISVSAGQGPYSFINLELVAGSENFSLSGGPTEVNTATISSPTITSATLSSTTNLSVDDNIALPVNSLYGALQSTIVRSISGNNITYDPIPVVPDTGTAKWSATPSFIEFRRNYLYKQNEWRQTIQGVANPAYNGQNTQIKNLWESKFHRYLMSEGNVLQRTWQKDQDYAIVIAPRNINGGNSETSVIRNTVWKNNVIRDATKGFTLQSADGTNYGCPATCSPVQRQQDLILRNNLIWNVGVNWDNSGAGHQFITFNPAAEQGNNTVFVGMKRVFGFHNTWDNGTADNSNGAFSDFGDANVQSGCFGCLWFDNTSQDVGFGWKSNASVNASVNVPVFFPPGDTTNWNKNYVVNLNGHTYPGGAITQSATWTSAVFEDFTNGDFRLKSGASGHNAALNGGDTGVDVNALKTAIGASTTSFGTATIKTVTGDWSGVSKCNWHASTRCQ